MGVGELDMVAHIYNPSYPGSRNCEDCGSRSVLAKSSQDSISTNNPDMMVLI
jgi:hypothetical protein